MDRTQKIDCGTNAEVIFTGATIKFQVKKGLTQKRKFSILRWAGYGRKGQYS
jgi:hypothetical protein